MGTQLSCSNCFFWVASSGVSYGECHRNCPTIVMGQISTTNNFLVASGMPLSKPNLGDLNVVRAVFPVTTSGNWCGEWQDEKAPWNMLLDPKLPPRS